MGDSTSGTHTAQGHSRPGPLVVEPGNPTVLLTLPSSLFDDCHPEHLHRLNMIQLEYARDVTLLQSRAYDAILRALSPRIEE